MFDNAVNIKGRTQKTLNAAAEVVLDPGVYDVWADTDTYIKVTPTSGTASNVSSSDGYLIAAGNVIPVQIAGEPAKLGTSAACKYHQVK